MNADLQLLTHQLAVSREMRKHEPLKSDVVSELLPGPAVNGEDQFRGSEFFIANCLLLTTFLAEYIKNGIGSGCRKSLRCFFQSTTNLQFVPDTVGSCSMLPRDKQGVVSPELVVYGTKNVRVVDLSIIPLHFAAHPQGAKVLCPFIDSWLISACHQQLHM